GNPESGQGVGVVGAALGENENGAVWEAAVPSPRPAAERPVKAPLLSDVQMTVDGRAARGWVRRLLTLAHPGNARRIDGMALLEAAVCHDDERLDALARAGGMEAPALRVAAQMAALPLLQACTRRLAGELPPGWWEGYCPMCGASPGVSEYTGLERKRRLRSGSLGNGWGIPDL